MEPESLRKTFLNWWFQGHLASFHYTLGLIVLNTYIRPLQRSMDVVDLPIIVLVKHIDAAPDLQLLQSFLILKTATFHDCSLASKGYVIRQLTIFPALDRQLCTVIQETNQTYHTKGVYCIWRCLLTFSNTLSNLLPNLHNRTPHHHHQRIRLLHNHLPIYPLGRPIHLQTSSLQPLKPPLLPEHPSSPASSHAKNKLKK